jgi:hypothetical protein
MKWSDELTSQVVGLVTSANRSIQFYCPAELPERILKAIEKGLDAGMASTLVVGGSLMNESSDNPFYLYKILHLSNLGGYVFTAEQEHEDVFCLRVDHQVLFVFEAQDLKAEALDHGDNRNKKWMNYFEVLSSTGAEFRSRQSDIQIEFWADHSIAIPDTSTNIHWKVSNAIEVYIDGLGAVSNEGSAEQLMQNRLLLNLTAYGRQQKKIKTLCIEIAEKPQITYEVEFFNPTSNAYVALPEDAGTGVFGVSKGHRVRVRWNVKHADAVRVKPLGLSSFSGEHEFLPDEPMQFYIEASLQDTIEVKRIMVQSFPVPVFTDQLIEVDLSRIKASQIEWKPRYASAEKFLEDKGLWSADQLNGYKRKVEYNERIFRERFEHSLFQDFYEQHNHARLNRSLVQRMKSYFRNEPSIIELIKSMREYYG